MSPQHEHELPKFNRRSLLTGAVAGLCGLPLVEDLIAPAAGAADRGAPSRGKPSEFQIACMTLPYSQFPLARALEGIKQALRAHRHRIAIFHYAGHADEGRLMLERALGSADGAAHAEGLAGLLGDQRGLKLAFLNGCSTLPQVDLLRGAGVPAVIATSRAINDAVARDFAITFYEALTVGRQADGTLAWYPLSGGEPRPTRASVPEGTVSIRTTPDGRWTFVAVSSGINAPNRIDRIDLLSGKREAWRTFPTTPTTVDSPLTLIFWPRGSRSGQRR